MVKHKEIKLKTIEKHKLLSINTTKTQMLKNKKFKISLKNQIYFNIQFLKMIVYLGKMSFNQCRLNIKHFV